MRWKALAVILTGCRALVAPSGSCWPVAGPAPRHTNVQRPRSVPACCAAQHAAVMRVQRSSEMQVFPEEHCELTLALLTTDIEHALVLHDQSEWDIAFSAKLLARPDGLPALDCANAIPEQPYSRALARALLASHARGLPLLPALDGLQEIDESVILETWSNPTRRHHSRPSCPIPHPMPVADV